MSEKKLNILCLDGGSPVGGQEIYSIMILLLLETQRPGFLDNIDLVAGVSGGSMVALNLVSVPDPLDGMLEALKTSLENNIFAQSSWRKVTSFLGLKNLSPFENFIKGVGSLKGKTLGDVKSINGRYILVPTVDLNSVDTKGTSVAQPRIYKNFGNDADNDADMIETLLKSSSVPVLFPIFENHVDGAFSALNPSMLSLVTALEHLDDFGEITADDVNLISIANGYQPFVLDTGEKIAEWGYLQWLSKWFSNPDSTYGVFIDLMIQANLSTVNYECRHWLGDGYLRVNPEMGLKKDENLASLFFGDSEPNTRRMMEEVQNTLKEGEFERILEWVDDRWFQ